MRTVFRKCLTSFNKELYVILQKYGRGGGRGGRTSLRQLEFYFGASLFNCSSFFVSFFLSLFVLNAIAEAYSVVI